MLLGWSLVLVVIDLFRGDTGVLWVVDLLNDFISFLSLPCCFSGLFGMFRNVDSLLVGVILGR